jgi:hypothetical protein
MKRLSSRLNDIDAFRTRVNSARILQEFNKNDVKRPFVAQVVMCRAKNGELLTNKDSTALGLGGRNILNNI